MKSLLVLALVAVAAARSFAAFNAYMQIDRSTLAPEPVPNLSIGTLWVPGTGISSTGTVSLGTSYTEITIGDVNGDGRPDLMAAISDVVVAGDTAHNLVFTEMNEKGKVEGTLELDQAQIYSVKFPSKSASQNGNTGLQVTFISPLAPVGGLVESPTNALPAVQDVLTSITNVDTSDVSNISAITLTFPPSPPSTTGTTGTTGNREHDAPNISEITITKPVDAADGFDAWMNSTIANNGDTRTETLSYLSPGGVGTLVLSVGLESNMIEVTDNLGKKHTYASKQQGIEVVSFQWGVHH